MYQTLQVTAPPAVEPVSVAEARRHCRIDSSDDDQSLQGFITVARVLAEEYLGRVLITQSLLWSVADAPMFGAPFPGLPAPLQVLPLSFSWLTLARRPLELPRSPVQSVDQVLRVAVDGTVSASQAGDYDGLLGSDPARLRLLQLGQGGAGLIIGFSAGYGATPDKVPMPIRQAILMLTAWLYENRGDAGGDWPVVVDRLLAPYRIMYFG